MHKKQFQYYQLKIDNFAIIGLITLETRLTSVLSALTKRPEPNLTLLV